MKKLLILNLFLGLALASGLISCKSKKGKSSKGLTVTVSDFAGNWLSTKSGKDAIANNAATVLQFSGSDVSAYGSGPFKLNCATTQPFTISGSNIVVSQKDSCAETTIKVSSLSASSFEANDGSNTITFEKQSDTDVKNFLVAAGQTEASVAEPFKHFFSVGTTTTPTTPVDNGSAYDSYKWVELAKLKLSAGATTVPENANKSFFELYRHIYFQGGAIVADQKNLTENANDVSCDVEFNLWVSDAKRILEAGKEFLMLQVNIASSIPFIASQSSLGTITMNNQNVVRQIQCRKYGTEPMLIGDLRKAMGSYITIGPK